MQYKVISPIKSDGHTYKPGDMLDLTEHEAAPLLQGGAIEPMDKTFNANKMVIDLNLES